MSIDVAIALIVGSFCGATATMFVIAIAFAVMDHKNKKKGDEE